MAVGEEVKEVGLEVMERPRFSSPSELDSIFLHVGAQEKDGT